MDVKRHRLEEIISKLREVQALLAEGDSGGEVVRRLAGKTRSEFFKGLARKRPLHCDPDFVLELSLNELNF